MWFQVDRMLLETAGNAMQPIPVVLDTTLSTNDVAKSLLLEGTDFGSVVISRRQTSGRGRKGRPWQSPAGGLYMSLVLQPSLEPQSIAILTLLAGCAVVDTIRTATGLETALKWPNDVLLRGKKLCGVLCELVTESDTILGVIMGIGINVNTPLSRFPSDVRRRSASLLEQLGHEISLERLAGLLFRAVHLRLQHAISAELPAQVIAEWKERNCTLGRKVRVEEETEVFVGVAIDVDQDGSLIVEASDGRLLVVNTGDLDLL
jgi:BirA family biotin operon repressor/biotin-[acetyl-CoA-carboxylase] ligase